MGRPVNKRNFGSYPTTGNQIILASAWLGTDLAATANCQIVKQTNSRKYKAATQAGAKETVCKLVDGAPAASGEARLIIVIPGSTAKNVLKLTQHRAYYGNGSGSIANSVAWHYTAPVTISGNAYGELDHA